MSRQTQQFQHRILLGIVIAVFGVLLLLGNLDIIETRHILRYWPVVFIAFGVMKIRQTRDTAGYVIGAGLIAAGALMTLNAAGVISFRMRDWWPVFMIFGGIYVVAESMNRRKDGDASWMKAIDGGRDSVVSNTAFMSGGVVRCDSQDFRGGELTAVMGGLELDLRQATIQKEAVLNVFALWGGIEIRVPQDWSVVTNGVPILGGIEDKTIPPMQPAKRLVIDGYAIMGGVEIKN